MSRARSTPSPRQARLEEIAARGRRHERRRTALVVGAVALVAALLVGATVVVLGREQSQRSAVRSAAEAPIADVTTVEDLGRDHVQGAVDYPQGPPVGGDHSQVWTSCGVYTTPTVVEQSVHSLEHGAVWITYRPDLPADQLSTLTALAERNAYVLLSPFEEQAGPVVASAWGSQLALDSAEDPRLPVFVEKYEQGPQTPEPGASCSGGAGAA